MYNVTDIEPKFKEFLTAENVSYVTQRNYLSDIRHFFGWHVSKRKNKEETLERYLASILSDDLIDYRDYHLEQKLPFKTINRRLSSLRKFFEFSTKSGITNINPTEKLLNLRQVTIKPNLKRNQSTFSSSSFAPSVAKVIPIGQFSGKKILITTVIILLIFLLGSLIYIIDRQEKAITPMNLVQATSRVITFQGKLKDKLGNAIDSKTDVIFRLYNSPSDGKPIYTVECVGERYGITPDIYGNFTVEIGKSCGSRGIPASIFLDNAAIYLGISIGSDLELKPRQIIPNVDNALNTLMVQGLEPGSNANSLLYINQEGTMLIAAATPSIRSTFTGSNFAISSANSMVFQSGGLGDIILEATEAGDIKFRTGGTNSDLYTHVTFTNEGDVGIGLLEPNYRLEVLGDIYAQSGQIRLGNFSTSPLAKGLGSLYYNTSTGKPYYWNGYVWQEFGKSESDSTATGGSKGSDERLYIKEPSGFVGIGTTSPVTKLDVNGQVQLNLAGTQTSVALCGSHPSGSGSSVSDVEIVDCSGTSGADYMEMYPTESGTELGDIVSPSEYLTVTKDGKKITKLKKTSQAYQSNVLGIVSDPLTAGDFNSIGYNVRIEDNPLPVALAGRVFVKISPNSSAIKAGDFLTTSIDEGQAMKSEKPGVVIGKALEPWLPHSDVDKILVYVNLSWHDPRVYLTSAGDVEIKSDMNDYLYIGNLENNKSLMKAQYYISKIRSDLEGTVGVFQEIVTGKMRSGLVETENIIVNNALIAKNSLIEKLLAVNSDISHITSNFISVREKIVSPVIETEKILTKELSADEIKSNNQDIVVNLDSPTEITQPTSTSSKDKGPLAKLIIKGLDGKTAATIDADGNASFSGELIAESLKISTDASISGKLVAKEILAENIDGIQQSVIDYQQKTDQLTTDSQQLTTNINDVQKLLAEIKEQPLPDASYYQKIDTTTIEKLIVTEQSNLYNLTVANSSTFGQLLIENNSILSLAWELKLSALSSIKFFEDAVVIAKDGTITTKGQLIAEAGIKTNEIKSLNASDPVKINELEVDGLSVQNKFDSSASAIIASADNFTRNGLSVPAIETQIQAAGTGFIPEGSPEVLIYNNRIKDDSLVYLTATSPAPVSNITVVKKESCSQSSPDVSTSLCKPYFKVALDKQAEIPVHFNWLVIN